MQKLLLLEDDISLVDGLLFSLNKNGFEVEVARTIKEAEKALAMRGDFVHASERCCGAARDSMRKKAYCAAGNSWFI